jgi:hypothetical protein
VVSSGVVLQGTPVIAFCAIFFVNPRQTAIQKKLLQHIPVLQRDDAHCPAITVFAHRLHIDSPENAMLLLQSVGRRKGSRPVKWCMGDRSISIFRRLADMLTMTAEVLAWEIIVTAA